MNARIYLVTDKTTAAKHLVKATNQAHAVRHIAASRLECGVASALDVATLMQTGIKVDDATAATTNQPEGDQA